MDVERHIRLFDHIARVYSWFFPFQVHIYQRNISRHPSFFMDSTDRILDIGCGTGALAYVLSGQGHQVTGIDGSQRMVFLARRLNRNNTAKFCVSNVLDLASLTTTTTNPENQVCELPFHAQQYDIVVASYVLHGLQQTQRLELYAAMKDLARKKVIIMDYNHRRGLLTSFIEWLEQGDYFNFIKSAQDEMRQVFPNVEVVQTGRQAAWYVCTSH